MNALFDVLVGDERPPDDLVIEGGRFPILTDFRHWMRVESTILDTGISDEQKTIFLLSTFMPSVAAGLIDPRQGYPFALDAAMQAIDWFYARGAEAAEDRKPAQRKHREKPERGYDFRHDIGLIYAAFRSVYQMDLMDVKTLHWWVFRALFDGLPEGAAVRSLIQARVHTLEKPTQAQKDAKAAIALPERIRYYGPGRRSAAGTAEWIAGVQARKEAAKG